MEVVVIEVETYNALMEKIKHLQKKVNELSEGYVAQTKKWLDIEEVCQRLKISKRTLQYYRERNLLTGTQIDKKFYYKEEDIDSFIKKNQVN